MSQEQKNRLTAEEIAKNIRNKAEAAQWDGEKKGTGEHKKFLKSLNAEEWAIYLLYLLSATDYREVKSNIRNLPYKQYYGQEGEDTFRRNLENLADVDSATTRTHRALSRGIDLLLTANLVTANLEEPKVIEAALAELSLLINDGSTRVAHRIFAFVPETLFRIAEHPNSTEQAKWHAVKELLRAEGLEQPHPKILLPKLRQYLSELPETSNAFHLALKYLVEDPDFSINDGELMKAIKRAYNADPRFLETFYNKYTKEEKVKTQVILAMLNK